MGPTTQDRPLDINSVSSALGLLSQFGSNAPALSPGQVIEAVVLALLEDGSVRLALPNATLDVRSTIPLTAGTSVRLLVKSMGSGLQLVVSPEATAGFNNRGHLERAWSDARHGHRFGGGAY